MKTASTEIQEQDPGDHYSPCPTAQGHQMHLVKILIAHSTAPFNLGYHVPSPLLIPYILVIHFMLVKHSTTCTKVINMDHQEAQRFYFCFNMDKNLPIIVIIVCLIGQFFPQVDINLSSFPQVISHLDHHHLILCPQIPIIVKKQQCELPNTMSTGCSSPGIGLPSMMSRLSQQVVLFPPVFGILYACKFSHK